MLVASNDLLVFMVDSFMRLEMSTDDIEICFDDKDGVAEPRFNVSFDIRE